ncbi:hypothetical protein [Microbulbifer halophilus]|uniref:hypothetical protein n=1 Tax=Microbulbifer halophilus TaxID=453963 RepID=UPI00361E3068
MVVVQAPEAAGDNGDRQRGETGAGRQHQANDRQETAERSGGPQRWQPRQAAGGDDGERITPQQRQQRRRRTPPARHSFPGFADSLHQCITSLSSSPGCARGDGSL